MLQNCLPPKLYFQKCIASKNVSHQQIIPFTNSIGKNNISLFKYVSFSRPPKMKIFSHQLSSDT